MQMLRKVGLGTGTCIRKLSYLFVKEIFYCLFLVFINKPAVLNTFFHYHYDNDNKGRCFVTIENLIPCSMWSILGD